MPQPNRWWGDFDLPSGDSLRLRAEELDLRVQSDFGEWQVQVSRSAERLDGDEREWRLSRGEGLDLDDLATISRFVFDEESSSLRIRPTLADRSVVASPRVATHLLPGQSATLYVSTGLWAQVEVQTPPSVVVESPLRRSSDTWFGPSKLEGELCYASRSRAVQSLENFKHTTTRAVTPLRVVNRAATPSAITGVKLPVRTLTLFEADDGRLWTNAVTMRREREDGSVEVEVASGPPKEAARAESIQSPRAPGETSLLARAFFGLFQPDSRMDRD